MRIKLSRLFFGGYSVTSQALQRNNYLNFPLNSMRLMIPIGGDQGLGRIKGTTKKLGQNYSPVSVCCFKRSTRELLWETTSKPDGTYFFRNIAVGLECFVVAFDPNGQYNAVISDKLVAK